MARGGFEEGRRKDTQVRLLNGRLNVVESVESWQTKPGRVLASSGRKNFWSRGKPNRVGC